MSKIRIPAINATSGLSTSTFRFMGFAPYGALGRPWRFRVEGRKIPGRAFQTPVNVLSSLRPSRCEACLSACAASDLNDPPQLARLVVGGLPGLGIELRLRNRRALLPAAGARRGS